MKRRRMKSTATEMGGNPRGKEGTRARMKRRRMERTTLDRIETRKERRKEGMEEGGWRRRGRGIRIAVS
jgi:hypothetical protein